MKVNELIRLLKQCPAMAEVHVPVDNVMHPVDGVANGADGMVYLDLAPAKPVAVVLDESGTPTVVARCDTVAGAEAFIARVHASSPQDAKRVESGVYSIDAPEDMVNPRVEQFSHLPPDRRAPGCID